MFKVFVAIWMGIPESVTWALKVKVPAVVGVPEMAPVLLLRVRPGGKEPLAIDQLYGRVPPLALRTRVYGILTLPVGSDAVVIVKGTA